MTFLTKSSLLVSLVSVAVPVFAATSAITQLSFITEPQVVNPGDTSSVITVQVQNATGGEEKLDETGHLTFVSTSPTGEFLGSTGKPVSTTMSKRTANRSFYYRDSTPGTYTLTVTVTSGDPARSWNATQSITVGSGGEMSVSEAQDSSDPDSAPTGDSASSHSAAAQLSPGIEIFSADAGRERSVRVHTPVYFEATKESPYGVYRWSFGDGGAGFGNRVTHTYLEPGMYVVVLNADFKGKQETSRTLVDVSTPVIGVFPGVQPNTFMLRNDDRGEVNVGGWIIRSGEKTITIPDDTILLPGRHLTFTVGDTVTADAGLFDVQYPDGTISARYNGPQLSQIVQSAHMSLARTMHEVADLPTAEHTHLSVVPDASTTASLLSPLILPSHRSWWQLFIETVFAR